MIIIVYYTLLILYITCLFERADDDDDDDDADHKTDRSSRNMSCEKPGIANIYEFLAWKYPEKVR